MMRLVLWSFLLFAVASATFSGGPAKMIRIPWIDYARELPSHHQRRIEDIRKRKKVNVEAAQAEAWGAGLGFGVAWGTMGALYSLYWFIDNQVAKFRSGGMLATETKDEASVQVFDAAQPSANPAAQPSA